MRKTIKGFILSASIVVSLVFFGGSYYIFSARHHESIRENALDLSGSMARMTYGYMFGLMSQGWNRQQLLNFLDTTRHAFAESPVRIEVYRGETVSRLFGQLEQQMPDAVVQQAFLQGETVRQADAGLARYIFPLKAEKLCQSCHTNARTGEVLGVIDVQQDLRPVISKAERDFFYNIALLAPLPFLIAFLVVLRINRSIGGAVGRLGAEIEGINRVSDLSQMEVGACDLGFVELNHIFARISALAERLKTVAVDKDLLEFEIRLLEKFILTSEVIRDWREYVRNLLIEINRVIEAYTLFCIFRVEDELLSLEIFWRNTPSAASKALMEKEVRRRLEGNPHFSGLTDIRVNHTVADAYGVLPEMGPDSFELQTKSFLVETPKIGGIVGIGVQAEVVQDPTRTLVMESILATLLNVVGSVRAIHKYTQDLEYYATRDPLTHLYNQRVFWELLDYETSRARRHEQSFAVMMVDLDNFKSVNDTYGHGAGDRFLLAFSKAVRTALRKEDILARYGGDEFVAILPEVSPEEAYAAALRVVEAASQVVIETDDGGRAKASASAGLALFPDHAGQPKELFLLADNMMYKAKGQGKNRVALPAEEDVAEVFRHAGEKSQILLEALERRAIVPFFQPIVSTADGEIWGVEVLSRLQVAGRVIDAEEFIELAEHMGVVHRLDYLVMDLALEAVAAQAYGGLIFFNLSPRALVLNEFLPEIRRIVGARGIAPERIVFEITERDTIKNFSLLTQFVAALKADGYRLAIDDFGSGFSSYHYLKHFPIDFVKIEGDFVLGIVNGGRDLAFVHSITMLAHELGIRTIAEFVESAEVLDQARAAGVDYVQGWHLGHPAPEILS